MHFATHIIDTASAPNRTWTVQEIIAAASNGNGSNGADGDGWTGGTYHASTGIVTFTSDDGLEFSTDDLRGATGQAGSNGEDGGIGPQGLAGNDGVGVQSVTINGSNELIVTLTDSSTVNAGAIDAATVAQGAKADTALQPADITAADTKATPAEADSVTLVDSEDNNAIKRLSWASLRAAVRSWLTGVANSWTQPNTAPVQAIAYASTIDDNCNAGSINREIMLSDNITSLSLTGGINGQTRTHGYLQDGAGGWTLTLSNVGGDAPVINTTAGAYTEVTYKRVRGQWQAVMAIDYGVIN